MDEIIKFLQVDKDYVAWMIDDLRSLNKIRLIGNNEVERIYIKWFDITNHNTYNLYHIFDIEQSSKVYRLLKELADFSRIRDQFYSEIKQSLAEKLKSLLVIQLPNSTNRLIAVDKNAENFRDNYELLKESFKIEMKSFYNNKGLYKVKDKEDYFIIDFSNLSIEYYKVVEVEGIHYFIEQLNFYMNSEFKSFENKVDFILDLNDLGEIGKDGKYISSSNFKEIYSHMRYHNSIPLDQIQNKLMRVSLPLISQTSVYDENSGIIDAKRLIQYIYEERFKNNGSKIDRYNPEYVIISDSIRHNFIRPN